ncbi:hypothetical protein PR048_015118 [Dryococelus australis]|uniref:Ig-like domain-containing protein n=1 Tax=Dryococelus australis TaxID=614101 RepID=A0ABQ9HG13_9NEOP|nr:hypothetical protein PR048_015118 [Dryococelus australis]
MRVNEVMNTVPDGCAVLLQMGYLDVVVPPDFVPEDTSGDMMVPEGGTVKLTCRARGYPQPHVLWRREDNVDLVIKEPSGVKTRGECDLLSACT